MVERVQLRWFGVKNVLMKIMVLAVFVLFLPFANARTFTDVPANYWAYSAINFVSDLGVMNGVSSTTFAPSTPATRASAAVALVKAFGLTLNTTGGPHFTDVPTTHWAYAYIETLYNSGFSTGCGSGKYCPDQAISRAQFTVLMVKSLGLTLTTSTRSSFPDVSTTNWAFKYIQTAQENGFVVGYTNGNFGPEDNALRDQLAVMLNRAIADVYSFTDVPATHWAYTPIVYVAEHGIMTGVNSTSFAPSQSLKRDSAAVVLVRALGLTLNTTGGPHFTDVPATHWAYAFIETLYNNGITTGCGKGKYCPSNYMTRAQLVVLFDKGLGLPPVSTGSPRFPDVPATHWAYGYVQTAFNNGLAVGYTNGNFGPEDVAKRDQTAVITWRAFMQKTPTPEQIAQITPTTSATPAAGKTGQITPTPTAVPTGKPASGGTGTFSIKLLKGWNLISSPIYTIHGGACTEEHGETLCIEGEVGVVVTSTTCSPATLWHQENGQYVDSGKLGVNSEIVPFQGFWANVAGNCELKLSGGTQVSLDGLHLSKGWNQIGGPLQPTAFTELKGNCKVTSGPLRYNTAAGAFEKAVTLQPGEGYFLKTAGECSLAQTG